ncbi:protein of unknown function [Lactiplantibacillus plantarum]
MFGSRNGLIIEQLFFDIFNKQIKIVGNQILIIVYRYDILMVRIRGCKLCQE